MKKWFIVLLFMGFATESGLAAKRLPKQFTQEEKIETLSKVWSEIKYNFAYADAIDFDTDSLYRCYLPMAMRTRNDVEFMDLLRRFIAAFDDGHTNVGYPSYNWSRINDYAPIRAKEIDGRYYLSYVSEWSKLDSLLRHIIDADYLLVGKAMTRINNGYGRAQGNWQPQYEAFYRDCAYEMLPPDTLRIDRSQVLRMPIVILTGKRTVSATETFLVQLMELPDRPRVIGQQTAGTTGSPLVVDLPHNAWVRICTLQHLYPISGKPFGKEGILPDEVIAPTLDDYLNGRDAVLERALKIIDSL